MKKSFGSWKAVVAGVIYGLAARALFALEVPSSGGEPVFATYGLMTLSFMFVVPFVVGLLTAYLDRRVRTAFRIMMSTPLIAVIALIVFTVLMGIEGLICAAMALPIFLIMSFIGGLVGIWVFSRKHDKLMVSGFVLLPFLLVQAENHVELSSRIFTVETSIDITASRERVWEHITRVRTIREEENHYSLFRLVGFPRPIEAELDTVIIGGIRKAIFDRGLVFTEIVTEMEPLCVLAFDIYTDPESIPPTALDEHVMAGGKYFDVLNGRYRIEDLQDGAVRLHLSSHFRLSTLFNVYSGMWSKLIMRDIQTNILQIIKSRCEG